mmetsp:Transcript_6120/g.18173  ORF Transcript_6120/g.18173 Transcript_6120/m.18173 type:complete len:264 (+) Transcript_6120:64-855(+)
MWGRGAPAALAALLAVGQPLDPWHWPPGIAAGARLSQEVSRRGVGVMGLSLGDSDSRPQENCACMNWRHVYESGLAQCGDGGETVLLPNRQLFRDREFCRDQNGRIDGAFYPNQDHELCINFEKAHAPHKKYPGSWCYVAATCNKLNLGTRLSNKINFKTCLNDRDGLLSQLPPSKLFRMAKEHNLNHTLVALMAYSWPEVEGIFPRKPSVREVIELMADKSLRGTGAKTMLSRKAATQTISVQGQTWEVKASMAVCVEGCTS